MKHPIKQIVFPLITVGVVLGAILLPGRISAWKDQAMMNHVHRENYTTNMQLPDYSLTIEKRMEMYAGSTDDEKSSLIQQVLTGKERDKARTMAHAELLAMAQAGFLSDEQYDGLTEVPSNQGHFAYYARYYLQDQETREAARVLICEESNKEGSMWMALDEESGHMLYLEIAAPYESKPVAEEFGKFFFDRLGVKAEVSWRSSDGYAVEMTVPGYGVTYNINLSNQMGFIHCRPYNPNPEPDNAELSEWEPGCDG